MRIIERSDGAGNLPQARREDRAWRPDTRIVYLAATRLFRKESTLPSVPQRQCDVLVEKRRRRIRSIEATDDFGANKVENVRLRLDPESIKSHLCEN